MNLTAIGEKLADIKLLELAPEFNAKMVRIMDAVGYIQKDAEADKKGNFGGYKYASARKVLDRVREACIKEGISVESEADILEFHIITTTTGSKSLAAVKTTLYFTDGFFVAKAEGLGSGIDSGDKAVMKGDTAAMKYSCSGKFLISWGDDPEADDKPEDVTKQQAIADWQEKCGPACTSVDASKKWWEDNKEQIKADCGEAGAADGVYPLWATYYERLKAEVAE